MSQNHPQSDQDKSEVEQSLMAAVYARVSSTGQMGRGGDDDGDGYSIPAQVKACEREAEARGATVVKVYIERAESARSDDRPVLQQMMRELSGLGVRFLIVHKVDRLARNRLDDATLYERMVGMNVMLVSASENIDETPAGRLMHGMLATFAEYYSNNLATEIKKGLHQKHQTGGTPFKPPVGYLPKRELIGNQDIRTVIVDEERAPFIQEAFDLYATGNWTTRGLAKYLQSRGFSSRPTPKQGAHTLQANAIQEILRNPYYIGVVVYCGRRVPNGLHDALIDRDTFDQVQALLAARSVAGDRPHKHQHYLRGTLYCAECGGRMLYGRHRGNGGQYEYFCCIYRTTRRQGGRCGSRHYSVQQIEEAIAEHYRSVHLTERVREAVWADVRRDADERTVIVQKDIERHQRKIKTLTDNQARLVQLSYQGLVSDEVLATEQHRLEGEKLQAKRLLEAAELHAKDIESALDGALAKTRTPHATYLASTSLERRLLNQTFFKRILIGDEGVIEDAELTPVYAALTRWEPSLGEIRARRAARPAKNDRGSNNENPDPVSRGQGSHNKPMVGAIGVLSNHEVQESLAHLAKKLAGVRVADAQPRTPSRQRLRSRRPGWVVKAVVRVLADREEPMRAKDIQAAVEALLGEPIAWSSIRGALASNVSGSSSQFVRIARGRYALANVA
jgi:site-specific DNA recombinase